jgi:hypothetical protein
MAHGILRACYVSWLHQDLSGTQLILNKRNKKCITLVSLYSLCNEWKNSTG